MLEYLRIEIKRLHIQFNCDSYVIIDLVSVIR